MSTLGSFPNLANFFFLTGGGAIIEEEGGANGQPRRGV